MNNLPLPITLSRRGLMFILSSPSGTGKTTLARKLLQEDASLRFSVSVTSRKPRPGEEDGKDYIFVDAEKFTEMQKQGAFLESAKVFGHFYGTLKTSVEEILSKGLDVLFDIDWQGAHKLRQIAAADLVTVFILPPSADVLEKRLHGRAQDSHEVVKKRMAGASCELEHWSAYDYVIINQDFDISLQTLSAILTAERLKPMRQTGLPNLVQTIQADLGL